MSVAAEQAEYTPPPNGFRTFLIVWVTQAFSVFGSALTFFSMTIWITTVLYPREDQKPELAGALALESLCFALPTVFLAPIAGAWADRHDRKRTMMVADFLNSGLSLLLLTLIATNILQLWMLLTIIVLFSTLGTFHGAAFDTSYAMLVPKEQLPRANGMMQTVWSLSGILSPVVAANIIALPVILQGTGWDFPLAGAIAGLKDGTVLAIGFDVITFLIAGTVISLLYIPSPKRTDMIIEGGKKKKSIWADVKEGALYIWHRKPMLWLLGTFTVANFAGSPIGVMQPLLVRFNLAPSWQSQGLQFEQALGFLASAAGVGGLVGGLFISSWGGLKKRRVYGVIVPMIIGGLAQIAFGLSPILYLSMATIFVVDAMIPILNAHSQSIWQTQTPHELQGRVFSVRRVIAQFSWPLSTAIAGVAGGLFNPGVVVAVLGGILVVFCVAQLFNPYLLRVEDKAYLDELAASRTAPTAGAAAAASDAEAGEPTYWSDSERIEGAEPVGGPSKR
jgi:MFS family permease